MERVNENDQVCGQPNEVENKVTVEHFKSLEDMLRCMYKKMSEDNQDFQKKMSEDNQDLQKKMSEMNHKMSEIKADN
jgi:hypothetical protein